MASTGHKIRAARKLAGLTQQQLAEQAGVALGTVARLERGQDEPRVDTLRKIAKALKVPVSELL